MGRLGTFLHAGLPIGERGVRSGPPSSRHVGLQDPTPILTSIFSRFWIHAVNGNAVSQFPAFVSLIDPPRLYPSRYEDNPLRYDQEYVRQAIIVYSARCTLEQISQIPPCRHETYRPRPRRMACAGFPRMV